MRLEFKKWLEAKKYTKDQKKRLKKLSGPSRPESTGGGRSVFGGSF
jgi:hypothetical protein